MIVAVTNHKGGAGKTTTVGAIAGEMKARGLAVLCVDLDPQHNLSDCLGSDATQANIADLLTNDITASSTIQTSICGIDIIRGDLATGSIETGTNDIRTLKEKLAGVIGMYDVIFIDTPPTLTYPTQAGLAAADRVIITTETTVFSLKGLTPIYDLIKTIQDCVNHDLQLEGFIVTRHNPRTKLAQLLTSQLEQAAEQLHTMLYRPFIRQGVVVDEAQGLQELLTVAYRNSHPAQDYIAITDQLIKSWGIMTREDALQSTQTRQGV